MFAEIPVRREAIVETIESAAMTPADYDELWAFFSPMVSRSRERFERALLKFPIIHRWRSRDKRELVGFLVSRILTVEVEGEPVNVIYPAWAAYAPDIRGDGLPYRYTCFQCIESKLRHPFRRTYIVMGASTTKSYRSVLRYGPEVWPRPGRPVPDEVKPVVAAVMRDLGESDFDPARGVLRRAGSSRYKEGVYADDPQMLKDPLVAFYAQANPGQAEGDSLLTVLPVTWPKIVQGLLRLVFARPRRKRRPS